jgi:hypothetical protein
METKFRKGDIVSIQGTVRFDKDPEDDHVSIELAGAIGSPVWVKPETVTVVQQRIEVGDSVVLIGVFCGDGSEYHGQILAIFEDHAWVAYGSGEFCTRMLSTLKRAES